MKEQFVRDLNELSQNNRVIATLDRTLAEFNKCETRVLQFTKSNQKGVSDNVHRI